MSAQPLPPVRPPAPGLSPFAHIRCEVGEILSLGAAPMGERRCVPLLGGEVTGPGLRGRIVEGGTDWQWLRSDGVLELQAHYIVATPDGARVEIQSNGLRHGPSAVMDRLARGEPVAPDEYFFRTVVRFATGHADWQHLNRVLALARGEREARQVRLELWQIG